MMSLTPKPTKTMLSAARAEMKRRYRELCETIDLIAMDVEADEDLAALIGGVESITREIDRAECALDNLYDGLLMADDDDDEIEVDHVECLRDELTGGAR
jgi:hypothetical protein